MQHNAPPILHALETSGFAASIREAVWIYPIANVLHVVGVIAFFAAVAFMDVRLMGAFAQTPAASVVKLARRFAVPIFALVVASGFVLFAAEASHVGLNWMFQLKLAAIALGLANVLAFELVFGRRLAELPPLAPLPAAVRVSAFLSLAVWLTVAALGRGIAYV
jgi:hypothetical protein